jgi:dTDP-4-dehydrorhamnose reductase
MWLLIGKDGQLGGALFKHFKNCTGTSRHTGARPYFQLTDDPSSLPASEVVFIVAAKTKFRDCEIDEDAWSINVDSPIRIANRFKDSFIVYISSEAAEWSGHTAYGDQKRFAEMGLRAVVPYERLAIVRPDKVTPDRIEDLCKLLEKIGKGKIWGVHRFKK